MVKRLITAIFFVVAVLGGLYGGRYSFVALFAIITALCLWEFLTLVLDERGKRRDFLRILIGMVFGMMPFAVVSLLKLGVLKSPQDFVLYTSLLVFPLLFLFFVYELFTGSNKPFHNVAFVILAMVYIGTPFALVDFIAFQGEHFFVNTICGLLLLTWTNDTGAYVIGSKIGKTPLFPRISPKKTWEGSIGGVLVTLAVAFALSYLFRELDLTDWMVLGGIVAVFGSMGDLVESMLKRSMQIKDSGGLLPGHGGFLDRFDAFIFLVPFATAYLLWIR